MDKKHEAIDRYKKVLQEDGGDGNTVKDRNRIFHLIYSFLISINPSEKFQFDIFQNIITLSAIDCDVWMTKMGAAFRNIEAYIVLLYNNPWKAEFHKIKKYCGFYQTKIQSHLKSVETVFELVGYVAEYPDVLVLKRHVELDVLLHVAFDCLVASVECRIVSEIYQSLALEGISVITILECRKERSGSVEHLRNYLRNLYRTEQNVLIPKPLQLGSSREKSHNPYVKVDVEHAEAIPFIDEDSTQSPRATTQFTEGTFDDHMLASLQLVNQEQITLETKPVAGSSEEWSFVRKGLEKKFGKAYYDGQRGDILQREISDDYSRNKRAYGDEGIELATVSGTGTGKHLHLSRNPSAPPKISTADRIKGSINDKAFSGDSAYRTESSGAQRIYYPPRVTDGMFARGPSPSSPVIKKDFVLSQSLNVPSSTSRKEDLEKDNIRRKVATYPPSPGDGTLKVSSGDVSKGLNNRLLTTDGQVSKDVTTPLLTKDGQVLDNIDALRRKGAANIVVKEKYYSAPVVSRRQQYFTAPISESSASAVLAQRTPVTETVTASLQPSRSLTATWKCLHCTCDNPVTSYICHMCSKSRVMADGSYPGHVVTSKVCDHCTLVNSPHATTCEACEKELSGIHTVV